jgi:ABC-type ATPase involved in cell division
VIASHDHHLVKEFAQRVIVLENGQVQGDAVDPLPSVVAIR